MMKRKPKKSDGSLHEDFGPAAIPVLQGMMQAAAEKDKLPKRFAVDDNDLPRIKITDLTTGRSTIVGLHAYGEVRKALIDFFKE